MHCAFPKTACYDLLQYELSELVYQSRDVHSFAILYWYSCFIFLMKSVKEKTQTSEIPDPENVILLEHGLGTCLKNYVVPTH